MFQLPTQELARLERVDVCTRWFVKPCVKSVDSFLDNRAPSQFYVVLLGGGGRPCGTLEDVQQQHTCCSTVRYRRCLWAFMGVYESVLV